METLGYDNIDLSTVRPDIFDALRKHRAARRDWSAVYARRNAKARAEGFASYHAKRQYYALLARAERKLDLAADLTAEAADLAKLAVFRYRPDVAELLPSDL